MPEKPLTIATYAAGASLAAITLVYVFGPTFLLDEGQSSSSRKKGVVGLSNPANDCFINSVLQALAGLGDLRLYLIREVHRRTLDGPEVYKYRAEEADKAQEKIAKGAKLGDQSQKFEGLQRGVVTQALKVFLDQLNERPIYRKTITAQPFVVALEKAFRTRISRQQQDAQEFLQVIAERLCEEYHAGQRARKASRKRLQSQLDSPIPTITAMSESQDLAEKAGGSVGGNVDSNEKEEQERKLGGDEDDEEDEDEEGFPMEGTIESYIECSHCGFTPKASTSTFVTLTLHVPQKSSTSLSSCFDGIFKTEHIDDFRCDRCRLTHALEVKASLLARSTSDEDRKTLSADIDAIKHAIEADPENPPETASLPPISSAPKRRIARHMRISTFPKILAIHLSRSIYNPASYSTKNMAKVSFPEYLPLGSLSNRVKYRLLATVMHKGGHNSGHYESLRRQSQALSPQPFSTPASFGTEGIYSRSGSPNPSAVQSPNLSSMDLVEKKNGDSQTSPISPTGTVSAASGIESRLSSSIRSPTASPSHLSPSSPSPSLSGSAHTSSGNTAPTSNTPSQGSGTEAPKTGNPVKNLSKKRLKKKHDNRWWRISDDRVREAKTSDVLGMQREVYLLFYELERD
jgi:ubiquitin carboxyl-terminal hydrolase 16